MTTLSLCPFLIFSLFLLLTHPHLLQILLIYYQLTSLQLTLFALLGNKKFYLEISSSSLFLPHLQIALSAAPEVLHHHGGIDMNHPILALTVTIASISIKEGYNYITLFNPINFLIPHSFTSTAFALPSFSSN